MRIEHTALYVCDLEAAKEFFVKYFGAEPNSGYHNERTGFRSYFLTFDGGARLEIMTRPDIADNEKPAFRTGWAHIAFSVGSREAVNAITERLRSDDYTIISAPRVTGDGYYESCISDKEGNFIEITE